MAIYIMLSKLTDKGSETVKENPGRIKTVAKEMESFGVRVIGQYAVLGPYDFVTIIEAPDNMTVSRVSMEIGARGSVKIDTLPAIPIDDFIAGVK
jgi:uncharacterized protein with GYD domain